MSREADRALVAGFVEEVQNGHNPDLLDKFISPDHVDHSGMLPPDQSVGLEGPRQFFKMVLAAFPDTHMTIHDQMAEGGKVVTRKTFSGTHEGEFMGISATGKKVEMNVIDIMQVDDGKITAHWAVADMNGHDDATRRRSASRSGVTEAVIAVDEGSPTANGVRMSQMPMAPSLFMQNVEPDRQLVCRSLRNESHTTWVLRQPGAPTWFS